jgi:hypothetical protein
MSVDASLYINRSRFDVRDVETVLRAVAKDPDIVVRATTIGEMYEAGHMTKPKRKNQRAEFRADGFTFARQRRNPYIHMDAGTPLGKAILLSVRSNPPAIAFLRAVGEITGGILEESDAEGKCEFLSGKLDEENGLAYHLKDAVLSGLCDGERIDQMNEARTSGLTEFTLAAGPTPYRSTEGRSSGAKCTSSRVRRSGSTTAKTTD